MGLYHPYERLIKQHYKPKKKVRPAFLYMLFLCLSLFFILRCPGFPVLRNNLSAIPHIQRDVCQADHAFDKFPLPNDKPSLDIDDESVIDAKTSNTYVDGKIGRGESIYKCLQSTGISDGDIQIITANMSRLFSFRTRSRPGDVYRLTLNPEGALERFEYRTGPLDIYCLGKDQDDKWNAWRENIRLNKYWVVISGEVNNSIFSTFQKKDLPDSLALRFAEIFEWKIDFQHEVREGDRFCMVVERFFKGEEPVGYGRIVAVMYDGVITGKIKGFYFGQGKGHGDYYDIEGVSLRRAFLRAPLSYKYISSGFTYNRKHPITRQVKPHLGIDFAAPSGSPVWAVADGVVISKTYDQYNGNQVKLRHMNNYVTYYNHLSSFKKGLKKGDRVKQKEVIGYVGTTGLSTGPHLDYRVKKDEEFINPLKAQYPSGKPLQKEFFPKYQELVASLSPILTGEIAVSGVLVAEVDSLDVDISLL
ncbi:peptidoglycan DD-metalloendopeptidase family protein [bacterium]|nr:peptidoglycan DD-metalloendopeptidase family protein [bacterium]